MFDFVSRTNPVSTEEARRVTARLIDDTVDASGSTMVVCMTDKGTGGKDMKYSTISVGSPEDAVLMLAFGALMVAERGSLSPESVADSVAETVRSIKEMS